jgi:hypothetical protein
VGSGAERQDLNRDVGERRQLQQAIELSAHDVRLDDDPPDCGLVQHDEEPQRLTIGEPCLALGPEAHEPIDLGRVASWVHRGDDRPCVLLSLEQTGHEIDPTCDLEDALALLALVGEAVEVHQ